jgi:hypothetical protein
MIGSRAYSTNHPHLYLGHDVGNLLWVMMWVNNTNCVYICDRGIT